MTDLVFRPLAPGETDLFTSMPDPDHETTRTGVAWLGRDFAATMETGHYRPQWTWVALDPHGTVKARAAWYGGPDDDEPFAMDWFDPSDDPSDDPSGDPGIGATLIERSGLRTDYPLILPPNWREDPATHAAATRRIDAARAAGMREFVERLHLTFTVKPTPDRGLPEPRGRLTFRPPDSLDQVRDVLEAILEGTLDAYSRRDVERKGAAAAAQEALDILLWLPGKRDGWRLAYTAADQRAGQEVGIVVPSRNYAHAAIAFVGVMPAHRGHGYAFDLLAEGTLRLVHDQEKEIHADTDTTNAPMAATFARAGYSVTQRRMILTYE
jgi:ribosomal protein S18 acetylase RimI-like enzyme